LGSATPAPNNNEGNCLVHVIQKRINYHRFHASHRQSLVDVLNPLISLIDHQQIRLLSRVELRPDRARCPALLGFFAVTPPLPGAIMGCSTGELA
jgi:hypothetical protein